MIKSEPGRDVICAKSGRKQQNQCDLAWCGWRQRSQPLLRNHQKGTTTETTIKPSANG